MHVQITFVSVLTEASEVQSNRRPNVFQKIDFCAVFLFVNYSCSSLSHDYPFFFRTVSLESRHWFIPFKQLQYHGRKRNGAQELHFYWNRTLLVICINTFTRLKGRMQVTTKKKNITFREHARKKEKYAAHSTTSLERCGAVRRTRPRGSN